MKEITYNAQTKEVTEIEISDGEIAEIEDVSQMPTVEERLQMAENTLMYLLMGGM